MKLITLLLTTLFNQDAFLVKQGDVEVPLSDLDAYVYLLPESKRGGFADQQAQIEQNIYTILNINIVYHYINQSDLKNLEVFKEVINNVEQEQFDADDEFVSRLNLKEDELIKNVRNYKLKVEFYRSMLQHLNETVDESAVMKLAREQYLIKKSDYIIPEKRDVSVIVLAEDQASLAQDIIESVNSQSAEVFHQLAVEHSMDPSTELNQGNWGEFRQMHFNHSFAEQVFNAPLGVIPTVFRENGQQYIVRVNEIKPEVIQSFDEVKDQLFKQLKGRAVVRQFQNIINTQAINELQVNPEVVAHVFERYKVFQD
jgi:parvulin-like peptidyl-prolyl isomerase